MLFLEKKRTRWQREASESAELVPPSAVARGARGGGRRLSPSLRSTYDKNGSPRRRAAGCRRDTLEPDFSPEGRHIRRGSPRRTAPTRKHSNNESLHNINKPQNTDAVRGGCARPPHAASRKVAPKRAEQRLARRATARHRRESRHHTAAAEQSSPDLDSSSRSSRLTQKAIGRPTW